MVLPGHISGGYIVTKAILSILHPSFSAAKINALLIIGTLSGELPDIDLVRLYFAGKRSKTVMDEDHRNYITHTPLVWLCVAGIIFIVGMLMSSSFTKYLSLAVLAGSWSHLLLDSIEYGVMWLWPFSSKRYSLIKKLPIGTVTARTGTIA